MADNLMYITKMTTQNYTFCRLQLLVETIVTQLNKPNNQDSTKVPTVVKPTNNKTLLQNFGDFSNKQPIIPSL